LQSQERQKNTGDNSPLNPPVVFPTVMPTTILHAASIATPTPRDIIMRALPQARSLRGFASDLVALPALGGQRYLATIKLRPRRRRPIVLDARRVRIIAQELSRLTDFHFRYQQFMLGKHAAITFRVQQRVNYSNKRQPIK
jgi:hypothetical protein